MAYRGLADQILPITSLIELEEETIGEANERLDNDPERYYNKIMKQIKELDEKIEILSERVKQIDSEKLKNPYQVYQEDPRIWKAKVLV